MKKDKIQNTVIKFKDNNINNECYLDSCNDIKTKGNDNKMMKVMTIIIKEMMIK